MNTKNLTLILNILAYLIPVLPEAQAVAGLVIGMIKQDNPLLSNPELIALLRGHGLANIAAIDEWFAAHPGV